MLEKPTKQNILIELHVPDFEIVKKFYSKLGFKIIWEREPEENKGYLVMKLEQNILCFWGGNESIYKQKYFSQFPKNSSKGYGVEIILMIKNINNYYQKLINSKIKISQPLSTKPWGLSDFRIADPNGFYIRITSPHDIQDDKYAVK